MKNIIFFPFQLPLLLLLLLSIPNTWAERRDFGTKNQDTRQGQPTHTPNPSLGRTDCIGGYARDYLCSNVNLLSAVSVEDLGGGNPSDFDFYGPVSDLWGWTDPDTGKEYVLVGMFDKVSFVDVSDPESPFVLGFLPETGSRDSSNSMNRHDETSWRDVKVYGYYAFVVSEDWRQGMQVFDLRKLRSVVAPPETFSADTVYTGVENSHNIAINEETGYAYIVGSNECEGGLYIVDISEPTNPTFAGCFSDDGYTHDTQCVIYQGPDSDYSGNEICFSSNTDTLTIVDVTNKDSLSQISRTTYDGVAYTHQGWLTEDQRYFILGDEEDEQDFGHNTKTYIWDLQDLDNPEVIGTFTNTTTAADHNLYVKEDRVYQANYTSGLRILSLENVAQGSLSEWGYFDFYPVHDEPIFTAAWTAFPFFDSGIIAVSGRWQGLFILEAQDPNVPTRTPTFTPTFGPSPTFTASITPTPTLSPTPSPSPFLTSTPTSTPPSEETPSPSPTPQSATATPTRTATEPSATPTNPLPTETPIVESRIRFQESSIVPGDPISVILLDVHDNAQICLVNNGSWSLGEVWSGTSLVCIQAPSERHPTGPFLLLDNAPPGQFDALVLDQDQILGGDDLSPEAGLQVAPLLSSPRFPLLGLCLLLLNFICVRKWRRGL